VGLGRHHAVVVARAGEDGRGVVAVGLVKLVVVILAFAEAVDDVAQQQRELRYLGGVGFGEVGGHLVRDFVLRGRACDVAAIARGVKDELPGRRDRIDRLLVAGENIGQRDLRLDAAARRGKRQRKQLVLGIELVDFLVGRVVGRMRDAKHAGVRRGLRLREHRMVRFADRARRGAGRVFCGAV